MQRTNITSVYRMRHRRRWIFRLAALFLATAFIILTRPAYAQTIPGVALDFDGNNDYVTLPESLNDEFGANRITVAGWFYSTAAPVNAVALLGEQYTDDGNIRFILYQGDTSMGQGDTGVGCGFYSSSGWTQTPVAAWSLNTWQHVACTYDQQNIKLYINGVVVATEPATAALPMSSGLWYVGSQWYYTDTYKGRMDEVRIWNRALTAGEIADEVCTPGNIPSGLVAYYSFNQGTALANNSGVTTLTDSSGNNRNGTLTDFALTGSASNWVAPGFSSDAICNTGPELTVQGDGANWVNGNQINVPVVFTSNGTNIAAVGFALDYQESCLSFDAADNNDDGVPDALSGLPAAFAASISHHPSNSSGELEIALYDELAPITTLSDGPLFTVQFTVAAACLPSAGNPATVGVNFAATPAVSFGDPTGADVAGTATGATITLQPTAAPTALALDNSSVAETSPLSTTVGAFTTTDADSDSFTYTLVSGTDDTDNASFIIVSNTLKTAALFDYETKNSYTIRVRTTDNSGNFFEQSFTITITDVTELLTAVDDFIAPRTRIFLGGQSAAIDVLANDQANGATLSVASVTQPTGGGGSVVNTTTAISYTAPQANGNTSFTYQATDGTTTSNDATVTVSYVANHARGDCNSSGGVSAADFIGIVLEIFDTNDTLYNAAPAWWLIHTGDFAGSPLGCDANASANGSNPTTPTDSITAADITCAVLIFFGHECGTGVQAAGATTAHLAVGATTAHLAVGDAQATAGAGTTLTVTLETGGNAIAAATFALTLEPAALHFDPTDADEDGVPDAITLNTPAGMSKSASWNADAHRLEVAVFGMSLPLPTLQDGTLATVTLAVANAPTVTSTPLALDLVSFSDPDGMDLPFTEQDGTLTIDTSNVQRSLFLPLIAQ